MPRFCSTVSVRRIARAPDADCITGLPQCVQCPIVRLMPARVVLWARVKPIAYKKAHNVAQPEMFHVDLTSAQSEMFHVDLTSAQPEMFHVDLTSRGLLCVSSLLVQNELIRKAVPGVARCIARVHVAHSMRSRPRRIPHASCHSERRSLLYSGTQSPLSQQTSATTMTFLLSLAAAKQRFYIAVVSHAFPFLVFKTLSRCGGAISRA